MILILLLAAGCIAIAVDHFASPPGGLRIIRQEDASGKSRIHTGPLEYPRVTTDSDDFTVRVSRPARRIASHYWSIDEYVYSVVQPERVVAVSESAYLPHISNIYALAQRYRPAIANDAERVLALRPDLVIASDGSRVEFSDLLRGANIPVYRAFTAFTSLSQIAATIRLTGYLTGEDDAAAAVERDFWQTIERAKALRRPGVQPPRILGLGGRSSYGDQTLFDDIVRTLGGINVGSEGGLKGYDAVSTEQILRWDPEWIVTSAEAGQSTAVLEQMLSDPGIALTQAARNGRILVFDHNVFLPMSPFTALLVTAIAEAVYG